MEKVLVSLSENQLDYLISLVKGKIVSREVLLNCSKDEQTREHNLLCLEFYKVLLKSLNVNLKSMSEDAELLPVLCENVCVCDGDEIPFLWK